MSTLARLANDTDDFIQRPDCTVYVHPEHGVLIRVTEWAYGDIMGEACVEFPLGTSILDSLKEVGPLVDVLRGALEITYTGNASFTARIYPGEGPSERVVREAIAFLRHYAGDAQ